jgi:hypothetical protein
MTVCAEYLKSLRKELGLKKGVDVIDKRYHGMFGYLAPDDQYYKGHCGHCAEAEYLTKKYLSMVIQEEEQMAFDSLPEDLQTSEKGEKMEEAVSQLEAVSQIEDIVQNLEEL